jgi:hypothetical protein
MKYESRSHWPSLEGGIPRQTARVDNVSHELCDYRIGAKYSMLVCQIPRGEQTAPHLANPVREVARR